MSVKPVKVVLNFPFCSELPDKYVLKLSNLGNECAKSYIKKGYLYDDDYAFHLDEYNDEICRHDPVIIQVLEEWIKECKPNTKDMEIIELRGNKYFIDYDDNGKETLRQPDDPPFKWITVDPTIKKS